MVENMILFPLYEKIVNNIPDSLDGITYELNNFLVDTKTYTIPVANKPNIKIILYGNVISKQTYTIVRVCKEYIFRVSVIGRNNTYTISRCPDSDIAKLAQEYPKEKFALWYEFFADLLTGLNSFK